MLEELIREEGAKAYRSRDQQRLLEVGWAAALLGFPELSEKMMSAWLKMDNERIAELNRRKR